MDARIALAALVGLLVGLAASFIVIATCNCSSYTGNLTNTTDSTPRCDVQGGISESEAGRLVENLLAASDVNATLLSVSNESGIYKVVVKENITGVSSEFYVTRDGRMLFQPGIIGVNETIADLTARRGFFECLASKGFKFYGSAETNSTLLQLQILGGVQFVNRIYVPCDSEQAQACADANVTDVPAFVYENRSYTGVKMLEWFINLTGCTL